MITALMCARNETATIDPILRTLHQHKMIGDIIVCVDGDTTDNTERIVRGYTDMFIPRRAGIKGKGQLITAALARFKVSPYVMFTDADYTGFHEHHVTIMAGNLPAHETKIGIPEYPIDVPEHVISAWPWVSGIRTVPVELIRKQEFYGYLFETQINQETAKRRYRFRFKHLPGLHSKYDMNPKRADERERDRAIGIEKGILKPLH